MSNQEYDQQDDFLSEPSTIGGSWETKPGWAIDPSDGERVYITGRGRLGSPDYQVSAPVYETDDDDIPVTYTSLKEAQRINDSPEAVEDRKQLAFYQEQHRQREQAPPDVAEMNAGDVYKLINHAASDTKFQQFLGSYDASNSKVQLTPAQQAQVAKFSKMFGSRMQNGTDMGVSPSQIMAAIEFYGLAKPTRSRGQANTQAESRNELPPDIREQTQHIAARLAGTWGIKDSNELDYRFEVVSALVNLLPPDQQALANQDPVKGADTLWKQFVAGKFDRGLADRNLPTSSDYRRRLRG